MRREGGQPFVGRGGDVAGQVGQEAPLVDREVAVGGGGGGQDLAQRARCPLHLVRGWRARPEPRRCRRVGAPAPTWAANEAKSPSEEADETGSDTTMVRQYTPACPRSLKGERAGVTVKAQASLPMPKPDDDSASEPRRGCLDEQEIVDFASGLLPAAKLPGVEEHLAACDKCTELVAGAAPLVASSMEVTHSLHDQAFGPQGISSQPTTPQSGPRSGTRDRPLLAPGTPLDNTYQVVRFLGRGGMGDVYEVKHARLAGRYAAKLLSSDLADNAQAFSRFQREALIASGLSHPNIVNVIDFCHLSDGLPCLVMEFLDGVDLAQVLALGQMSLMRTLRLVRQIVSALSTLHGHQIIHRDLKPQNIFVLPEHDGEPERVKLVDFGLAKRSNPSMVVTHDRTLLGTPQYMAPEQALGSAENVGPEADQFSLAAIVFEMLGGRHPFGGEVLSTVLYRIVHEPPTPLATLCPHVPPHVVAAIERALSKDRQARFPSVKAFLQALEGEGAAMTPSSPLTTKKVHRSWFIRREVLASAGVLAVAAGVAGVVRMTRPPPDPPVWRASQGPGAPAGSDPTRAPGASGRAPSPADNLTIEPAGTAPPPSAMPRAAVNDACRSARAGRARNAALPARAREENAGDKKTPPRASVRKKPAVAGEPSAHPVATKPAETEPAARRHAAAREASRTRKRTGARSRSCDAKVDAQIPPVHCRAGQRRADARLPAARGVSGLRRGGCGRRRGPHLGRRHQPRQDAQGAGWPPGHRLLQSRPRPSRSRFESRRAGTATCSLTIGASKT